VLADGHVIEPRSVPAARDSAFVMLPFVTPSGRTGRNAFRAVRAHGPCDYSGSADRRRCLRRRRRKTLVTGGSDARYRSTGHLVYAIGGIVFSVTMDLLRLEVTAGPVPIVEGVRRAAGNTTGAAQFDFSSTGSLVSCQDRSRPR